MECVSYSPVQPWATGNENQSDRMGRKRILLFTTLLSALGYLLLSLSFWLPLLFLSRILCGCFKHTQTLCKAYLADLHSAEEAADSHGKHSGRPDTPAAHRFSTFMTISNAGFVLGPLLGGHIAQQENGFQMVALLTAMTFFTIATVVATCLPVVHVRGNAVKREKKQEGHFGGTLYHNWDIFLLQLLISFSVMVLRVNYVQHAKEHFGMSSQLSGYLTSLQALLGVIGSACTSGSLMSRYPNNHLMLHTSILTGVGLLASSTTTNVWIYILSLSLVNFVAPFSRLAHMTQLLERSPQPDHHGALMGASQSVGSFCRLSSSFISGLAQDYFAYGPQVLSVVCTTLGVMQILCMY
ncbi:major facilitator superfamily domain-containing protein 9-like isoform X2 [Paramacrobiotus metropolitanus]|uniref:major facilitator superfamily domain-containing protein 9-like isoform X2 n=1 Tax=Paramacrobiotus metropolitanus TaxID=2943436 RepID=UPI002445F227|nr:major facilitator superfamily domain-containing protein 9-like isoform X2 [Paramacrobiotus metropolitanus]